MLLAAIGLIIGTGTGSYAAMSSMRTWRHRSYDASYRTLAAHDLHVALLDDVVVAGSLTAIVDGLPDRSVVAARTERLSVATTVDASTPGRAVLVEGRLIGTGEDGGVRPAADTAVDLLHLETGRAPGSAASGDVVTAALESKFAAFHGLTAPAHVRLAGGHDVEVVGTGVTPEQFVVSSDQGGLQSAATFATVYTSLADAQQLAEQPGKVNDLVVRLHPGAALDTVRDDLDRRLREALPDVAFRISALDEEDGYRFLYDDVGTDQRYFDVFAVIILCGVALAAFNLANRIVESQRREIGIGQALGMPGRALARRPLLIGGQIAVGALLAEVVVGLVVSVALRRFLAGFLPLPVWTTPLQLWAYGRSALLAVALPIGACAVPVWRASRMAPIDALRPAALVATRGGLLRVVRHRPRGRVIDALPFRAVLRSPRRSVFTALGIAGVLATVVTALGALDTFDDTIERSRAVLLADSPDRVTVQLDGFYPAGAEVVRTIAERPTVGRADTGIVVPAQLLTTGSGRPIDVVVASTRDTDRWRPPMERRIDPGDRATIVITEKAARDLGVDPGDSVVVRLSQAAGSAASAAGDTRLTVSAVTPIPLRSFAYIDDRTVALLGLSDVVNSMTLHPVGSPEALVRDVFEQPHVSVIRPVSATARILQDWTGDFSGFLRIVELIVVPVALLMAYNAAEVANEERTREHATMLAIGMRPRTIIVTAMAESAILGALATLAGLLAGRVVLAWVIGITGDTLPELDLTPAVHATTLAAGAALGVLGVGSAPALLTRRILRLDVPKCIRAVE